MSTEKTRKPWLKYGCFGCLGLTGVVVLAVATMAFLAHLSVRKQDIADGPSNAPETLAFNRERPTGPGKIVLDLRHGDFRVVAAGPGESLGADARFDRNSYELVEEFETDGDRWVYRVTSKGSDSFLGAMLKQVLGGVAPEVTVRVPTDVPVELDIAVNSGGMRVDLDDMWVTDAKLDAEWAGMQVACGEPLEHPLGSLEVSLTMGGLETDTLGNASPHRLLVRASKGGGIVDLRGAWTRDADIGLTGENTGLTVMLPEGPRIERSGVTSPPSTSEIPRPTLRIDSTVVKGRGNIEFVER